MYMLRSLQLYFMYKTQLRLTSSVQKLPTDSCSQSIYPPGFVPRCDVLQKQWTYNKTAGQCVEFYYHPCGEDREGYDVFASEQECIKTCVHKGIKHRKSAHHRVISNCQLQIHASSPSIHLGTYQAVKWYKSSGHTIKPADNVWNSTTTLVVKTGRVTMSLLQKWSV